MRQNHVAARAILVSPRFLPSRMDLFSIETSFVLFLFAGRYKTLPELRGFSIDFTLFFLAVTLCLVASAVISGKVRLISLNPHIGLMVSFSALAAVSLFWSSIDYLNVDKMLRFMLLTSPSFFVALLLSQDRNRRERLLRMLVCFSSALLIYYSYYRWVRGIDIARGMEWAYHDADQPQAGTTNYL